MQLRCVRADDTPVDWHSAAGHQTQGQSDEGNAGSRGARNVLLLATHALPEHEDHQFQGRQHADGKAGVTGRLQKSVPDGERRLGEPGGRVSQSSFSALAAEQRTKIREPVRAAFERRAIQAKDRGWQRPRGAPGTSEEQGRALQRLRRQEAARAGRGAGPD